MSFPAGVYRFDIDDTVTWRGDIRFAAAVTYKQVDVSL